MRWSLGSGLFLCAAIAAVVGISVASPRRGRAPLQRGHLPLSLTTTGIPAVAGRVLLRGRRPLRPEVAQSLVAAGAVLTDRIADTIDVIDIPTEVPPDLIADALSLLEEVEFAEPDCIVDAEASVSDPRADIQWHIPHIGTPAAWDVTIGNSSVKIAVLDTGCDANHPDLQGKLVSGWNFISRSSNTQDDHGHGTHVAGTAAAATNNAEGVAGVGYLCSILPVKVLDANGSGSYSGIIQGIDYAVAQGAKVINMSFGGSAPSNSLAVAVQNALHAGVLPVAAAGNSNASAMHYPAAIRGCLAVGASTSSDTRASFSNYGRPWVDVAAPGVNIFATFPLGTVTMGSSPGGYRSLNGTSMAAPVVAGVAGLLYSYLGSSATPLRVRSLLEGTAVNASRDWTAFGRVSASEALGRATQQGVDRNGIVRNVAVRAGQWRLGDVSALRGADGASYQVQSPTSGATRAAEIEVDLDGFDGILCSLQVRVRARCSAAATQIVSIYDWNAGTYDVVGQAPIGTAAVTRTYPLRSAILSYVRNGMIRLRIRQQSAATIRGVFDFVSATGFTN
ncbi:MAG: S8 family serine peptidase [Planctomycetes bacterium]|nr:S8 family serine peptidase [Planctomycetota bacterium]